MTFQETEIVGVYIIEGEPREDDRGSFARTFCTKEFGNQGIKFNIAQTNISFNKKRGTLRGMHFQVKPYEEAKLVRCTHGAILDVVIDLRPESSTFKKWSKVQLTHKNRKLLFVPEGLAHGFQTLEDNTEVVYQMSEYYHAHSARGVRWNDPAFGISWPVDHPTLSKKDLQYKDFSD